MFIVTKYNNAGRAKISDAIMLRILAMPVIVPLIALWVVATEIVSVVIATPDFAQQVKRHWDAL